MAALDFSVRIKIKLNTLKPAQIEITPILAQISRCTRSLVGQSTRKLKIAKLLDLELTKRTITHDKAINARRQLVPLVAEFITDHFM